MQSWPSHPRIMQDRLTIDTKHNEVLTEGGLRSPLQRLTSVSEVVQDHIVAAFGPMLPRILKESDSAYYYENMQGGRDTVFSSRALTPNEPWPQHELPHLLEGWRKLVASAESIRDNKLRQFLLDLQLPHPESQRDCYRLYRDSIGKVRMHVLWGFFPRGKRHRSLPIEQVMSMLHIDDPWEAPAGEVSQPEQPTKPQRRK